MAACCATILDRPLEEIDVDVASCGSSMKQLLDKIEEKAKCKIYGFPHEAIVDRVVKSTERFCIVGVCASVFNNDPNHCRREFKRRLLRGFKRRQFQSE